MIQEIFEHTVDLSLLPEKAIIADFGCRGFEFANYFLDKGHIVYCVDIDDLKTTRNYHRLAISHTDGTCSVVNTSDPQAKYIKDGTEIEKLTIKSFAARNDVEKFDLIKIDIEGAEYDILKNSQHPLTKQVSVEFHEHTPQGIGKQGLDNLLDWLCQYYDIHNRVWESRYGAGFNYWDILLTEK